MMRPLGQYPLDELKLVYRLLHEQLDKNEALVDSELLQELQHLLQARARAEGVDVTLHAQWATWLNDGVKLHVV